MVRIKILYKSQQETFKLKKFPVYLGSAKGKDIIPLQQDGVEPRHGFFEQKGDKLFYCDTSHSGTRVNNQMVKGRKVLMKPGTNQLMLGKYQVVLENESAFEMTHDTPGKKTGKNKIAIFSSAAAVAVVGIGAALFFLLGSKQLAVKGFSFSAGQLSADKPFYLSSVDFGDAGQVDTQAVKFTLVINGRDSLVLDGKKPKQITLPAGFIDEAELEKDVTFLLKASSEKYKITGQAAKNVRISNRERTITQNGVVLNLNIKHFLLDYSITSKSKIEKVEIDFGDGGKISSVMNDKKIYLDPRVYNFKAAVFLSGSKTPTVFSTKVKIQG